ncbi:MAG TPA: PPOX class F420-dependent oxidoreductase [Ktedonobacteraceae bacterium]
MYSTRGLLAGRYNKKSDTFPAQMILSPPELHSEAEKEMGVIPEKEMNILKSNSLAHVATIGPKHEPQSNPVWFDWDGTYVRISQTKTRQKYHNIQRDPHIALSITDPQNPYHYLEIRGKVVRVEEDQQKKFIDALAKKYLGVDHYPYSQPGEERVTLYVQPEHTTSQG